MTIRTSLWDAVVGIWEARIIRVKWTLSLASVLPSLQTSSGGSCRIVEYAEAIVQLKFFHWKVHWKISSGDSPLTGTVRHLDASGCQTAGHTAEWSFRRVGRLAVNFSEWVHAGLYTGLQFELFKLLYIVRCIDQPRSKSSSICKLEIGGPPHSRLILPESRWMHRISPLCSSFKTGCGDPVTVCAYLSQPPNGTPENRLKDTREDTHEFSDMNQWH